MKKFLLGLFIGLGLIAGVAYSASVFTVQQGGTGKASVANGGILYGSTTNQSLNVLSIGTNGKVLQSNGTVPTWVATSTLGIVGGSATTTINNATGPAFTIATTTDTNLLISVITGGSTATITPAWTGTLADARITSAATWNAKVGPTRTINTTAPIQGGGDLSADRTITCNVASGAQAGCLSSADWTTFNGKQATIAGGTNINISGGNTVNMNNSVSLSGTLSVTGTSTLATTSIPALLNLNTNGFVKTSGGNGLLSVDTNTYLTGNQTITFSGDVTGSGATSITTSYNNVVPTNKGGTGTTTAPSQTGQILAADGTGTKYAPTTLINGTNVTIATSTAGQITINGSSDAYIRGLLSASNPITYNSSTGAIGWTNSNSYITLGSLSGTAPITYNNGTGAIGITLPLTEAQGGTGTTTVSTQQGQLLGADSTGAKYGPITLVNTATHSWGTSTVAQLTANVLKVPNALTFNNSGSGAASGQTFDGSSAATISYNTIGAQATLTNPDTGTGTNGQVAYFTGSTALASAASLLNNGAVVGINATSSNVALNVQGISGSTANIFNVASSSGSSYLQVAPGGKTTLNSLLLSNVASGTQCLHADGSGNVTGTGSDCGSGGVSGGTNGYLARWTGASTLSTGLLLDNATVAGVNATSSSYTFNLQAGAATKPFNIASSSGTSFLSVDMVGNLNLATLTASSLLMSDASKNLQSVSLGNGIALSGSTLSQSLFDIDSGTPLNSVLRIRHSFDNFLSNSSFEYWQSGTSVAPSGGWIIAGDATVARSATTTIGAYSAAITFGTANTGEFYQDISVSTLVDYTYSAYVQRTSGTGGARLVAQQEGSPYTEFQTVTLPTAAGWNLITLTVKPSAGTVMRFSIKSANGVASTWLVDEAMMQESKGVASAYLGRALDDTSSMTVFGADTFLNGLTVGETGTTLGTMKFFGNTSGTVTVQPAAAAGTWTMTLPTAAGSANQFLQTNGSGVTSWATALTSSGLTNGRIPYALTASTLADSSVLLYNGAVVGLNATSSTVSFNIQGTTTLDPFNVASSSGTSIFVIKSNLAIGVNTSTPAALMSIQGTNSGANTSTPILIVASSTNDIILKVFADGGMSYATSSDATTTVAFAGEYYSMLKDNGTTTATSFTLDWGKSNVQRLGMNAASAITLTFANYKPGGRYLLMAQQASSTAQTITWPSALKWSGGTAPTLTSGTYGQVDLITFVCNVTNCYGASNTNFSP